MSVLTVSNVRFTRARELDVQAGLIGWISCDVDGFHFDGLTLRRTSSGRPHVSYPAHRSNGGRKFAVARPNNSALEAAVAEQIFAALQLQGVRL